jgi:hypothetical protein
MTRHLSVLGVALTLFACHHGAGSPTAPDAPAGAAIFTEDFESGTLGAWDDGVDPSRHQVVTNPQSAESGSRYLAVTYRTGGDGGWLNKFFMPGFDTLHVSVYVRLTSNWLGATKMVMLYGSRIDNQWSGFGTAGVCPTGTDFFASGLVTKPTGNPGPLRFYTYYPAMARDPGGVCFGRYGDGTGAEQVTLANYAAPIDLSRGAWHHLELRVHLNTPGSQDGYQSFSVDGAQGGQWSGLSFRNDTVLRLNALQLSFSTGNVGVAQNQELDIDNIVVRAE